MLKQFGLFNFMKSSADPNKNYIRIRSGNRSLMSFLRSGKTEEGIVTVGKVLERLKYLMDQGKTRISR
jgi:hypothetical protein